MVELQCTYMFPLDCLLYFVLDIQFVESKPTIDAVKPEQFDQVPVHQMMVIDNETTCFSA